MMLLGHGAVQVRVFSTARRSVAHYAIAARSAFRSGLALAWYGTIELERVRFAMPQRTIADLWNYAGAVLASVGYAATA